MTTNGDDDAINRIELAKPRHIRLYKTDEDILIEASRKTGLSLVELVRTCVRAGLDAVTTQLNKQPDDG